MKDKALDIEEMIRVHFQAEENQTKSSREVSQRFFHKPPVDRKTMGLEKRFDRSVQISRGTWRGEDDFSSEQEAEEKIISNNEKPQTTETQSENDITEHASLSEELVIKQPIKMDPQLGTLLDRASVIPSESEAEETEKTNIREQRRRRERPVIHLEPIKINWAQWSPARGLIDIDAEEKAKAEAERMEQEAKAIAEEEAARREAEALREAKEKQEQEEYLAELQKANQSAYQDAVSAYQEELKNDNIDQQSEEAAKMLKDLLKEHQEDAPSIKTMDSVEKISSASEADESEECEDQQPIETFFSEEKDEEPIKEDINADDLLSLNTKVAAEPIADLTDEEIIDLDKEALFEAEEELFSDENTDMPKEAIFEEEKMLLGDLFDEEIIDLDEEALFDEEVDKPKAQGIFFKEAKTEAVIEEEKIEATEEELFSDEKTDAPEETLFEEEEILSGDLFEEEIIDLDEEALFDEEDDEAEEQEIIFEDVKTEAVIEEEKIEAAKEELFSNENTDAPEETLFEEEEILPGDQFEEEVIDLDEEALFDEEVDTPETQGIFFKEAKIEDVIEEEKIEAAEEELFSGANTYTSEETLFEEEILSGDLFEEESVDLDKEALFDDQAEESEEQGIIFEDARFFEEEIIEDEKNAFSATEAFVETENPASQPSIQAESGKSKAGKPASAGKPAFFKKPNKAERVAENQDILKIKDIPFTRMEEVENVVDELVIEIDKDDFAGTGLSFLDTDKDFLKAIQLKREMEKKETIKDEQFFSISEAFFDQKNPEEDCEVVPNGLMPKDDSDEVIIEEAEEMVLNDHPNREIEVTEVFTDIPALSSEVTDDEAGVFFEEQPEEYEPVVEEQPVSEIQPLNDITPSRTSEAESAYFDRFSPENSKRMAAMDEFFRLSNSEDEIPSIFDHFPKAGKETDDKKTEAITEPVKEEYPEQEQSYKKEVRSFPETLFTEEICDETPQPTDLFFEETIVPESETLFEESVFEESKSSFDCKGKKAFGEEVFSDNDLFFEEEELSDDDLFFEEEVLS